jgi:hypothetical protein
MWTAIADAILRAYPTMAENLTVGSLPMETAERKKRIERFYQANARNRTYFGFYFEIPGFKHAVSGIEIEDGLYTGIYCPDTYPAERQKATAALAEADIHGQSTAGWTMWRTCTLSGSLYEPDDATLTLLGSEQALREAAEQCATDVYAAWSALMNFNRIDKPT